MDSPLQLCPACGTPAAPGAAFCDACGVALTPENAARDVAPATNPVPAPEPTPVSAAQGTATVSAPAATPASAPGASMDALLRMARAVVAARREAAGETATKSDLRAVSPTLVLVREVVDAAARETARRPAAAGPAIPPPAADDVPFELEWDEAREFIEGRGGQFAFRFRALCDFAKAAVAATVNGADAGVQIFTAMQGGKIREGLIDVAPDRPGTLSVKLRVETVLDGGTHESFEADRAIGHVVYPATHQEVKAGGNVTVNYAPRVENNTGIVRQEDARISVSGPQAVRVDHWADQDRVLGRRGSFKPVPFSPTAASRENARFRAAGAALDELLVVPGSDRVSFGRSASRADVRLLPETPDGRVDESRSGYVSGVHFTVLRDRSREEFQIYDGAPGAPSTNGLSLDGQVLRSPQTLPANDTVPAVLAPYAVAGGALPVEFETHGWDDPAAVGCTDRHGNLSSLLVRRRDNPRKAVLVVWGGAMLDPILGTKTGLRIVARSRQLRLVRPDGSSRRLIRLAGTRLGDTPYDIR